MCVNSVLEIGLEEDFNKICVPLALMNDGIRLASISKFQSCAEVKIISKVLFRRNEIIELLLAQFY